MAFMVDNDGVTTFITKKEKKEMKKFEISYTDICYVEVEAESAEEAMKKFTDDPTSFMDDRTCEGFQDPSVIKEF